jgi:hypothetical protein
MDKTATALGGDEKDKKIDDLKKDLQKELTLKSSLNS